MKRLLALVLTITAIALNLLSCGGVGTASSVGGSSKEKRREYGEYVLIENYMNYSEKYYTKVLMGEYPQSLKAEDVTVAEEPLEDGYYLGSDGERYACVTIDSHDSEMSRCGCEFEDGKDYYFKVEPIMWSVVERYDDKMLLICDKSLYTSAFGETTSYMKSKVREELNSKFLNTAFTEEQRKLILPTLVDNSAESAMVDFGEDCPEDRRDPEEMKNNPNVCPNTEDKIFILSRSEAYKYRVWLSEVLNETMYCRAMGVCKSSYYWYRSPSINTVWDLMLVEKYYPSARDGIFYGNVRNENIGVRPAMWISELRW